MQATHANTGTIKSYKICKDMPDVDISKVGTTKIAADDGSSSVVVDVIPSTESHVALLKTIFDFGAIKALLEREDFSMIYDSMHGVNGPFAKSVFVVEFGQPESVLSNHIPKDDFNGGHADPNLTYAKELVGEWLVHLVIFLALSTFSMTLTSFLAHCSYHGP